MGPIEGAAAMIEATAPVAIFGIVGFVAADPVDEAAAANGTSTLPDAVEPAASRFDTAARASIGDAGNVACVAGRFASGSGANAAGAPDVWRSFASSIFAIADETGVVPVGAGASEPVRTLPESRGSDAPSRTCPVALTSEGSSAALISSSESTYK